MPTMTQAGYTPPQNHVPPEKKHGGMKKPKKKKKKINVTVIVSLLIFLAAVLIGSVTLLLFVQMEPYIGTFVPGTSLMGYPLAGLTAQEGESLLNELTRGAVSGWSCEMTWGEKVYTLTAEDMKLSIDASATLDPLWQIGRSEKFVKRYLSMLAAKTSPTDAEPVITYDMAAADALLETIRQEVERDPIDAAVEFMPGSSEPFRFTQESVGLSLDTAPMRSQIEEAVRKMEPVKLMVEPEKVEPAVYQAELENAIVMRGRVTLTLVQDEAAAANAGLAANALNGLRIDSGETLSFNEVVGTRTAAAGYVEAAEPAYGSDVSGVGGGVCQMSTALYQAALLSEITVEARSAAAYPVPYSQKGQEAAVSDQGLDLVLKNDTDMPLFVTARVYQDGADWKAEVVLIGMPIDGRYHLETTEEEIAPPDEPVYVRDNSGRYAVYKDERVPGPNAQPGYRAKVERVKMENGEEKSREWISENEYPPIPQIIYVGSKER